MRINTKLTLVIDISGFPLPKYKGLFHDTVTQESLQEHPCTSPN